MQLKIGVNQKVGMPNYGSAGASCEIVLDLAEHTVSEHPEALVTEIRRAYALAHQSVLDQLARTAPAAGPAAQPEPAPPPSRREREREDYDRQPSQARAPSAREPERPRTDRNGQPYKFAAKHEGTPPTDGRQLFAWAKKQEEQGCRGLISCIEDMGNRQEYPRKFGDWNHAETADAVALWRRMTAADAEPDPEPARNGNGYHR
jgi:hypothetical protein